MSETTGWRELHRTNDVAEARLLAVSILAMEFEARLRSCSRRSSAARVERGLGGFRLDDPPGDPPYIIEVRPDDWHDLSEVLDDIIQEQREFDAYCDELRRRRNRVFVATVAVVGGAMATPAVVSMLVR